MTSILAARKLAHWDGKPSPAVECAIADAIAVAERTTLGGSPKPSDYALGSLESRAAARALQAAKQKRFRLIIHTHGQPLNLDNSTWHSVCVKLLA